MQGYIKLKDTNEELYEINLKKQNKVIYFFMHAYLEFVVLIKRILHIITVKEIQNGLIFILPCSKEEKNIIKCAPKLKKLMQRYKIYTIILSDEIRENKEFLEYFQNNRIIEKQIHILNEKEIMPYIIKEIIEYILKLQNKDIKFEDLYIILKQDKTKYKENIAFLAQFFKTINIVTPNLKTYQKLANKLMEKYGVILTVTNNKKKSLRKAKWIVNFDMTAEEIKKYTIFQKSTIIYVEQDGVYTGNAFEGIHILKAGIDISEEIKDYFRRQFLLPQFSVTVLYESILINKKSFNAVREQMAKDRLKITNLYGIRGILSKKELEKERIYDNN